MEHVTTLTELNPRGTARDVLDYIDCVYANLRRFGITEDDRPERWGTDEAAREWWEISGRRDCRRRRRDRRWIAWNT